MSSSKGDLCAYADANWAGDETDRKSTTGFLFKMGDTTVHWRTSKQNSVALSSCEAEFLSASEAGKDILWLRCILSDFDLECSEATVLFQDNQGAIL